MTISNTPVLSLVSVAVSRGKGSNAVTKAKTAHAQGAAVMALAGAGFARKAIIDSAIASSTSNLAHGIAFGQYASAIATIVTLSGRPFTYSVESTENDKGEMEQKVVRADWLRLRAELVSVGNKACAKALRMYDELQAAADVIRDQRAAPAPTVPALETV